MRWTKIQYIKDHSRIDFDCDDGLLEQYATAAENTILSLCNRSYESLLDEYDGKVPAELYTAVQLLVDAQYTHRSPVSVTNMSIAPYNFDLLIKPFMVLSGVPLQNDYRRQLQAVGDMRTDLDFFAESADAEDETLTSLYERIDTLTAKFGAVSQPTQRMLTTLRTQTQTLKADVDSYLNSLNA